MGKHKRNQTDQPDGGALPGLRAGVTPRLGVILPRSLFSDIREARAAKLPLETGGFLIGVRRGPHFEIAEVTQEGADDIATKHSFERVDERHKRQVEAAWQAGEHHVSVVGDWHSHPYGDGMPSSTDRQAWRTLSRSIDADCIGLVLGGTLLPRLFLVRREAIFREVEECLLMAEEPEDLVFGVH